MSGNPANSRPSAEPLIAESPRSISLLARSDVMRSILARLDTVAESDSSVLLIGETGVGKELIAEYAHRRSPRADRPLVKVGLSAIPPDLLESELFGHDKGAYTSASGEKKGLFELANGGTIFLDDIDDFPFPLQSKLLRVLESREVIRVGGVVAIPLDVRLITATKIDLKLLIERNQFRADLYYRINVVPIEIPPLRARREDIPILISHYLSRFATGREPRVADDAMKALTQYDWPGNVRELRNIIQRIALFIKEEIRLKDLPPEIQGGAPLDLLLKACERCFNDGSMSFEQVVACLESNLLRRALDESKGNKTQAAQLLKLNPSTLRDKLKKYGMNGKGDEQ